MIGKLQKGSRAELTREDIPSYTNHFRLGFTWMHSTASKWNADFYKAGPYDHYKWSYGPPIIGLINGQSGDICNHFSFFSFFSHCFYNTGTESDSLGRSTTALTCQTGTFCEPYIDTYDINQWIEQDLILNAQVRYANLKTLRVVWMWTSSSIALESN